MENVKCMGKNVMRNDRGMEIETSEGLQCVGIILHFERRKYGWV